MIRRAVVFGAAWAPLGAAIAQARRPLIGLLEARAAPASGDSTTVAGIKAALAGIDLREGQHYDAAARYGVQTAELDAAARELVALQPAVIVTVLTPAGHAARRATSRIPIVLAGAADPVATGLVASLARPGGNVTGVSALGADTAAKCLQLLREWLPAARRVGALLNRSDPFTPVLRGHLQAAARETRFELLEAPVDGVQGMGPVVADWVARRVDAVFVQPSLPVATAAQLGLQHRVPVFSFVSSVSLPKAGGLFSFGASPAGVQQTIAGYVRRILDGAQPAELPVQQPDRYELVINAGTARALGLAVPASLRLRAFEVID